MRRPMPSSASSFHVCAARTSGTSAVSRPTISVHQWRRIRQPRHRWRPGRGGSMVGIVGVPHGVDASIADTIVFRNVGLRGGVAPARAYIPELLDDVLEGRINPGRVFDFETDLDHVADAYKAMDERRAIKSLIRIETKETGP